MPFETKIIRTRDYRRTPYGIASMLLFLVATIVIFFIKPEVVGKDYLNEWFGDYAKPILLINFLFYLNGVTLMFRSMTSKILGFIKISDNKIEVHDLTENSLTSIDQIDTIHLIFKGYAKGWKLVSNGKQNFIHITDKQKQIYQYEFIVNTKQDKLDLIESLQTLKEAGVFVKVDFNPEPFYEDNDFRELRKVTYNYKA